MVLGIDSSTEILSIGLADNEKITGEKTVDSRREHASLIIGTIDKLLNDSSISNTDISGVAVAIGPGSFTGIRIGLAVAKGMAAALEIPITGVSTFEIIGKRLERDYQEFCLLAQVRKGEYYFVRFSSGVKIVDSIVLVELSRLPEMVSDLPWALVGESRQLLGLPEKRMISSYRSKVSGGELALYGAGMIRRGLTSDPDVLEPLYVAPSQAERKFGTR